MRSHLQPALTVSLGADGFALITNSQGHYLGDERFMTVFQDLNNRKAKAFIHPTSPCQACISQGEKDAAAPIKAVSLVASYLNPVFEFIFDTARTIVNLFMSGTVARNTGITFILPSLGGAIVPAHIQLHGILTEATRDNGCVTERRQRSFSRTMLL